MAKEFKREVAKKEPKKNVMVTIEKASCKDDFDNMCFRPADGGQYTVKDALFLLENGNGGAMVEIGSGAGKIVSYNKEDNKWIRDHYGL